MLHTKSNNHYYSHPGLTGRGLAVSITISKTTIYIVSSVDETQRTENAYFMGNILSS